MRKAHVFPQPYTRNSALAFRGCSFLFTKGCAEICLPRRWCRYADNVSNFAWVDRACSAHCPPLPRAKCAEPGSTRRQSLRNARIGRRHRGLSFPENKKERDADPRCRCRTQAEANAGTRLELLPKAGMGSRCHGLSRSVASLHAQLSPFASFPRGRAPPHQVVGAMRGQQISGDASSSTSGERSQK